MPKPVKSVVNGARSQNGVMPSFVRCELSEALRNQLHEKTLSDTECMAFVEEMALKSIKVSLAYETQNDAFGAYATGTDKAELAFKGLCLTARGPSLVGAISALALKHYEILAEDWRVAGAMSGDTKWG